MPTTNMALTLPTEDGSDDVWDTLLNAALTTIDEHDHTTGRGARIPSAALKIDADVPWSFGGQQRAITDLLAVDLTPQYPALVAGYASALFANASDANNLYWRNQSGVNVRITNGATLDLSVSGGIGGDYAAAGALVSFDDASDAYLLQQQGSPRPWARVRCGDLDVYEAAASIINRVRIKSPSALASSYELTLLAALPGAQSLLHVSSAGVITASNAMAVDADIAVSGTGDYLHGERTRSQYPLASTVPAGSYSTSYAGSVLSFVLSASGTAVIPLTGLRRGDRVITARLIGTAGASNNPTVTLIAQVANTASAVTSAVSGTLPGTGSIALTPNTPYELTNNATNLHLYVQAAAGGTTTLWGLDVVYDHV